MVPSLAHVRDLIARVVAGDAAELSPPQADNVLVARQIGSIALRPHQVDAARRAWSAMQEFGGALLADEPGLGKTFVALAVAREHVRALTAGCRNADVLVLAPAALRNNWRESAARAGIVLRFVSLESLSRRDAPGHASFVVIDESHHACNPATARYPRVARVTTGARVLLLSATPVRNRAGERTAMLALFCGRRALTLTESELARCVIRRGHGAAELPRIVGPHWRRLGRTEREDDLIAAALNALPPPLPLESGLAAAELVTQSLVRCWASSLAALATALQRRVLRGAALHALLTAQRLPSRRDLRDWVVGDDAMQMAFPELGPMSEAATEPLLRVLDAHVDAVRQLLTRVAPMIDRDTARRARFLMRLQHGSPQARIVAFTSHATTATALYASLRHRTGTALLTASGARTAGGPRPRADILRALASGDGGATRADRIMLVIATDVLSEGVNLQGASVVVHLDLPWTPAGLEQRVGRSVRMGSSHAEVHVFGVAPSPAAQRILGLNALFTRKREAAGAATAPARVHEQLVAALASWRCASVGVHAADHTLAASACATLAGAIAVVRLHGASRVVVVRAMTVSDAPADVLAMVQAATARPAPVNSAQRARMRRALTRWVSARRADRSAGALNGQSPAARLLFARLSTLLDVAPTHERGAVSSRVQAVRSAIPRTPNAGADAVLRDIATHIAPTDTEWLTYAEQKVGTLVQSEPNNPVTERAPIIAMLLLSDEGSGPARPTTASRPRASAWQPHARPSTSR